MENLYFKGQYTDCVVFNDYVEESAIQQIYGFLNHPAFEGLKIRIQSDVHAGAGAVIGFTSTLVDKVIPNVIGVDLSCFTGDTKVPLLDGTQETLKSLCDRTEPFYVYSIDTETRNVVPGLARAMKTKDNAKLMEVCVSGGEIIRCTPDHKFMMYDGSYLEARELKPFMSLMPLYRSYQTRDGYEHVKSGGQGCVTHKMVDNYFNGPLPQDTDVHHIDYKWWNNDPSNLLRIDRVEHQKLHGAETRSERLKSEAFKRKKMKTISERGWYYDPKFLKKKQEVASRNLPKCTPEWYEKVSSSNKLRVLKEVFVCEKCGRTIRGKGQWTTHQSKCTIECQENHKVLFTRDIADTEDVYCLQVEKYHNFALAAGVFVHNCGVASLCVGKVDVNFQEVDDFIRSEIPSGFSVRGKPIKLSDVFIKEVTDVCEMTDQDTYRVLCSIGSLGGGNHFIEIGKDERDFVWVTVHTGSRNFGLKIAKFHQDIAKKSNPFGDLSYLTGAEANAYFHDMKVAQKYAALNRMSILESIANQFWYGKKVDYAESVHNYIDFQHGIVRKGAISAQEGEQVVIPWNMRDGLIIGVGKGNPEYNFSAPHGAGRVMGRMAAKRTLELEDFQKTMEGVWSSCVSQNTIDESPMAYKDYLQIENRLSETVEIKHKVKPLYNFKASE